MADEERWHLLIMDNFCDGSAVDIWAYCRCELLEEPKTVPFTIQVEGKRVDYNPTAFLATVVSRRMAEVIASVARSDIQRIAALVVGEKDEWEVLNILPSIDCIDHSASCIQYFPADHPTKGGQPRGVLRLVLDPARIGEHHIFHPKDWEVAAIVSGVLKGALDDMGATGIEYVPVTG